VIKVVINRIKELREKRGITQHKVGMILDLPQSKVSDIERGKRNIKLDEAMKVATFFNVKVDDLVMK
jgi:putative transcriptional regulator